jgi:hypothetical protein
MIAVFVIRLHPETYPFARNGQLESRAKYYSGHQRVHGRIEYIR